MSFGEKLKYLRKQKNITQSDFADLMFVTRQAVQKWENDVALPDTSKLPDIAKFFGVSIDLLLDNQKSEKDLLLAISKNEPVISPKQYNFSVLDYMLLIPFGLGIAIIIGMGYGFGAMLAIMPFAISFASLGYSMFSVINIFLHISSGACAILIAVAFVLLGVGLFYPCLELGKICIKKYSIFVKKLNALAKKITNKWRV